MIRTIQKDGQILDMEEGNEELQKTIWHTTSHILAQAVKRLYPNTKLGIGPAIENGFYYDFDVEKDVNTISCKINGVTFYVNIRSEVAS